MKKINKSNISLPITDEMIAAAFKKQQKYGACVIDPPWDVNQKGNYGAERHYDLMTLKRIYDLPVSELMLPDSHIYLWVTNSTVEEGYKIVRHWGFEPKNLLVWDKAFISLPLGYWFRNCTEFIVFAVRGHTERKCKNQPNIGRQPTQDHSHKPEEYYSVIRRISPGPYLELFARRPEPGFDAWGNEIPSDIVIPGYPVPVYSGRVNTNLTNLDSPDTAKEA